MKIFEDQFMDIQIGMVSSAMEYVQGQAEKVYIYAIAEEGLLSFDLFYKINGYYSYIHKVNDYLSIKIDDSDDVMFSLLGLGLEDIQSVINLHDKEKKKHPTEMWLIYDTKSKSLDTRYSYEGRYDKDDDLLLDPVDEFGKWFEEVRAENL